MRKFLTFARMLSMARSYQTGMAPAPFFRTVYEFCRSRPIRSEEHTSELQSLMRHSYAVFWLKKTQARLTPTRTGTDKTIMHSTTAAILYRKSEGTGYLR